MVNGNDGNTLNKNANARSVDNLRALFNVIVGLAIAESIRSLISINDGNIVINFMMIPLFVSLFVTILPFHHGAARYLDSKYVENTTSIKSLDGILDYAMFIIEAMVFFACSLLLNSSSVFYNVLLIILGIDIIWTFIVVITKEAAFKYVLNWMLINIGAIAVIVFIKYVVFGESSSVLLNCIITAFFITRTLLDYKLNWHFYWPNQINA